jgi:hypothetical protein
MRPFVKAEHICLVVLSRTASLWLVVRWRSFQSDQKSSVPEQSLQLEDSGEKDLNVSGDRDMFFGSWPVDGGVVQAAFA